MIVRIFDKNGEPGTCWRNVARIKLLTLPRQQLLNLNMTMEDGQVIDFYLSDYDRFAVIEKEATA